MKQSTNHKVNIIEGTETFIKFEIQIPIGKSMLDNEEHIQVALNEAGLQATAHSLCQFDTDGSPISIAKKKFTSKGLVEKIYQTPYGEALVARHVYQSNEGGSVFCPLEKDARIQHSTTPKFCKMVCSKYAEMGSTRVEVDLSENHGRKISRGYIQNLADYISLKIEEKSSFWQYAIPVNPEDVNCIAISLDGTCMLMVDEGYRQAMVGSISLYDKESERLYSIYVSSPPEHGKETFYQKLKLEIDRIIKLYPNVTRIGIADGAQDNWTFLEPYVSYQIIDFYHVTEYLGEVANASIKNEKEKKEWMTNTCHQLKHEDKSAKKILKEINRKITYKKRKEGEDKITKAITYFENHLHQMDYSKYQKLGFPIGSGVIESACKVIIKQRLCNSGMKWKAKGAKSVLDLRCLCHSGDRWQQTWSKINKFGL